VATAAGFRFKDDRRAADRPVRLLHVPNPPYAELTVLTACRVWRSAEEGRHCSKTTAGRWALARDPTLGVVADALHQRHGDPTCAGSIRPVGSTPRRSPSCWRWSEHGSPRRAIPSS